LLHYLVRVGRTRQQRKRERERERERGGGEGKGREGGSVWQVGPQARDRKPTIDYQACYYDGERRFFRD